MCRPFLRTRTSPTSRSTFRCFETEGCSSPIRTTRSPTGSSTVAKCSRISRRRGSATALKGSEVVAARAMMKTIYSYIGICQEKNPELALNRAPIEAQKKRKFAHTAKLPACWSKSLGRLLAEAFLNGIAPARTVAGYEPQPFMGRPEPRRKLLSAQTLDTGFCWELLPIY